MIIDDLTPTLTDNLTDEIPVEQGNATLKTTWQKVVNLVSATIHGTMTPNMDGTAAVGSSNSFAREDHIHPTDTSRAKASDFEAFTVTLSTSSWSTNVQTVSDAKFIASGYAYMVSPSSSSFIEYGEAQIYADDVSTDGQMTFHCVDEPSSALTVNIVRTVDAT